VKSGKYHYNRKNELLSHSFLHAVTVENSFGERKIDKQPGRRNSRIDPVDAAIDAHFCRMKGQPKRVDLNSEMERYLSILKKSR
jgi:phage terminase large subunit-like protein